MSDPSIQRWRQQGNVYLWRFPRETRNFPGWHFTADDAGCLSLVDLFGFMLNARWPSKCEIELADPTSVAVLPGVVNQGRCRSPNRFAIHYPKDLVPDNFWMWEGSFEKPMLKLGRSKVEELVDALESVRNRVGDFCVHDDDQCVHGLDFEKMSIWFW